MLTVNPLKAFPSNFKIKKKGSKSASSSQKATAGHSRLYHRLRDAISHHGGAAVVLLIVLENQWCLSGQNPRDWERDARRALKHNKDKWQKPTECVWLCSEKWDFLLSWVSFSFLAVLLQPRGRYLSNTGRKQESTSDNAHAHAPPHSQNFQKDAGGLLWGSPRGWGDFWHGQQHIIPLNTHTHRSGVTTTILTHPWGTQKERQAGEISADTAAFTPPPTPTPHLSPLHSIQTHPSTSPCSQYACPV